MRRRSFAQRLVRSLMFLAASCLLGAPAARAAEFTVEKSERGVTIKLAGKLFTEYLITTGAKPILWPVIGPTGKPMTRAYPMEKIDGEKADHPHQRSFWLTHGTVNKVDFWSENKDHGKIAHREWKQVVGGATAVIETVNDWNDAQGKKVLEDTRKLVFSADADSRSIDFTALLKASEGDVIFGDTKEGSFGVRVPTVMDVDSKKGGKIVNSEGAADKDTWGKRARWVDYHGPVEGDHLGVAILNHPSSFRYPTYWHVRTYGLFAANPFGIADFTANKAIDGSHTLKKGETMTLRYLVVFHKGDAAAAKIEERFKAFAAEK